MPLEGAPFAHAVDGGLPSSQVSQGQKRQTGVNAVGASACDYAETHVAV